MKARAVHVILKRCLGHRDGESVLVVTDPPMEPRAREFLQHAQALGVDTTLITMPVRQSHGEEPPRAVAEALKTVPIAVLLTTRSLSHTTARRDACEKHGTRVASMPGGWYRDGFGTPASFRSCFARSTLRLGTGTDFA